MEAGNCRDKLNLAANHQFASALQVRYNLEVPSSQHASNITMARKRKSGFSMEAAKTLLRGAGLRCTAARIAVVQTLGDHQTPLSPNEVADELAEFGFDKSTIYRSLTELDESGIVTRLDLGDAIRRFELLPSGAEGRSEHPHFMCVDCGKVMCLSGFQVELVPENPKQKPPGEFAEVLLKGHCNACL